MEDLKEKGLFQIDRKEPFDIKTFKVKVLNEKKEIKYELLENEISKNGYSYIKFDLNDINPINPQTKFTFTKRRNKTFKYIFK